MTITDYLELFADKTPTKVALIDPDYITYQELFQHVLNFSSSIQGITKSSIITLMFDNSKEFIISYLGTIYAGHVAHLISPNVSNSNLESQIKSSKPKMVISTKNYMSRFGELDYKQMESIEYSEIFSKTKIVRKKKPESNDFAYLIYTSGTTSEPKGIGITHSQSIFTTNNIIKVLGYNSSDVNLVPLPFFHSFGLGCLHTSICTGASLVIHKNSTDITKILDSMKTYNATTFAAVPATLTTMLQNFKNKVEDYFSNLRLVITNSTSIPVQTVKDYKKILQKGNLATYYGLTEASRSTFMIFKENIDKETSVGMPAPDVQIKSVKEKNEDKFGKILIKGKNVIRKYWNNIEADKKIVDEWLETGDLGFLDSDGYLYLVGRSDDLINVGGYQVNPEEIENIVKDMANIKEAVAVGIKHKIFGHVVKLFVQKLNNSDLKKSDIMAYCIKNMERYKVPTSIEFVEEFPRTEYGKIKRFMLQE